MIAIFKREFRSYFIGMTGYLFVAAMLFFMGIFVSQYHLIGGYSEFQYSLQNLCTVLLLIVPILTMRSLAEDKRAKTDRLLYSLPLPLWKVILGKYFAMLAVLALPTVIVGIYPLILSAFGGVSLGQAYACLLAFYLLGAALIALCLFLSALADSQVMAAVLGFGAVFLLYLLTSVSAMIPSSSLVSLGCILALGGLVAWIGYRLSRSRLVAASAGGIIVLPAIVLYFIKSTLFEGLAARLLNCLALFDHFESFFYGILDIPVLILYLSVTVFFVALTVLCAEKKRWN